jgi:hypothetical protein
MDGNTLNYGDNFDILNNKKTHGPNSGLRQEK